MKKGLLLVNLGSPEAPTPKAVGQYLREFLMDPYVVDIPYWLRWFLVNGLIVPRRKKASAESYKSIWTEQGSPLLVYTQTLRDKLAYQDSGTWSVIDWAMRYGRPHLRTKMQEMMAKDLDELYVLCLYPQYAKSSVGTCWEEMRSALKTKKNPPRVFTVQDFYDHPEFLQSFAERTRTHLEGREFDTILFSFHGLPERHIREQDPTGKHCLQGEDCCREILDVNRSCYRAQCYATARGVAGQLGLSDYSVAFQSRLGAAPWIRPYTDEVLAQLPASNKRRVAVVCPSFVADCLETLEEVQIRMRQLFLASGGEFLELVPSLNETWAPNLQRMLHSDELRWQELT